MPDVLGLKPEDYWNKMRSVDYDSKKNIEKTQREMTLKSLEILGLSNGKILDAGCGSGFSTRVIQEQGFKVVGVDVSEEMVKLGKSKGLSIICADMSAMPFENSSFDGLISISALQWVTGGYEEVLEKYHEIIFEFARVLKSGGLSVIQFYPSTLKEFDLVKSIFSKKFIVEVVSAWSGRKTKRFLKLKKKR
ncbi:MAG: methyltransferase domain-containing protein [Nanoarchaeota archaeon]|nr:methyltransferase domain-containing protein [Nanoarchaeota archaeon]